MQRNCQLIGGYTAQALERRPQLLQEIRLFFHGVTASQNAVQGCSGTLFAGAKSGSLGVRKKNYVDETAWDFHYRGVDARDFFCDSGFRFVGQWILRDRGVQWHLTRLKIQNRPTRLAIDGNGLLSRRTRFTSDLSAF